MQPGGEKKKQHAITSQIRRQRQIRALNLLEFRRVNELHMNKICYVNTIAVSLFISFGMDCVDVTHSHAND